MRVHYNLVTVNDHTVHLIQRLVCSSFYKKNYKNYTQIKILFILYIYGHNNS